MKKATVLIFILLGLNLGHVLGQRFKGGVLTGMNASQIDGDTWGGYYKTGFVFGAFVQTDFDEKWGGQLEIKYSSKGSANGFNQVYPIKIRLRYVDMPILATYNLVENLKIETGVSINYLFSTSYYSGEWFDDNSESLKPIETALNFGVNYSFFSSFDFNLRFSYSLFPIRSNSIYSNWGEGAFYNNVLTFALYFHIGNEE